MKKFKVRFENEKDTFETVMCDYATGTNEFSVNDSKLFSIWV